MTRCTFSVRQPSFSCAFVCELLLQLLTVMMMMRGVELLLYCYCNELSYWQLFVSEFS